MSVEPTIDEPLVTRVTVVGGKSAGIATRYLKQKPTHTRDTHLVLNAGSCKKPKRKISAATLRSLAYALQTTKHPVTLADVQSNLIQWNASPLQRTEFFSELGRIPLLKTFIYRENEYSTNGVSIVASLLQRARNLKCLRWVGVFRGRVKDFQSLAKSLTSHPCLSEIEFKPVVDEKKRSESCTVQKKNIFLAALRSITNLRKLEVDCWDLPATNDVPVEDHRLTLDICTHPSIVDLFVGPISLPMMKVIKTSQRLQRLTLTLSSWEEEICYHIAELVGNSPVIDSLKILHKGECPGGEMYEYGTIIQLAAQGVKKADQYCKHFIKIIEALKRNSSLKQLTVITISALPFLRYSDYYFEPHYFPHSILKSFRNLLEHDNMTLEGINLAPVGKELKYASMWKRIVPTIEDINRFLLLNKNGRKDLVENLNAPREDWVNCLAATSHDVIGLHYMLSKNPSICSITPTEPVTPASSTRRKRRARANSMSNCNKVARK